jgi:hypothetical protein
MGELYALVSAGGSPGVTTAAIALALTWPSPVILAECDPSGGDVLAGLLAGHVPARQGLMEHAIEAGRYGLAAARSLPAQLIPLDADRKSTLLPGLTDPRQAPGITSAWPALTATLTAQKADIIADCGRLDAGPCEPLAVLSAARTIAVVLRPTLRQVWSARPRVDILAHLVGPGSQIALLVTGPGTHSAREVSRVLGVSVAAVLPDDARSAALLSDGAGSLRILRRGSLLRSAQVAGNALRDYEAVPMHQAASAGSAQ